MSSGMAMSNFNTLQAAKELQDAGVETSQAEAMVNMVAQALTDGLATKEDVRGLDTKLDNSIAALRKDMQALNTKIDNGLENVTNIMTIRLGGIVIGGIAFLQVLNRVFPVVPTP